MSTGYRSQPLNIFARQDFTLLFSFLFLLALGLVMVASASMSVAEQNYGSAFYFVKRQSVFITAGLVCATAFAFIPMAIWQQASAWLYLMGLVLLVLVLIPGIGHEVNGSIRWLRMGFFNLQVSELIKLFFLLYISSFIARRQKEIQTDLSGFAKPLVVLAVTAGLLLMEPDFGAVVVLSAVMLSLLFLAGAPIRYFLLVGFGIVGVFALLILSSPYRMARFTAFIDPWAHQFASGYQLTQALIAFGRGEWFGLGLGASVQKLFYLPEAHTDFVFAVLAEELGLIGVLITVSVFALLVVKILMLGQRAIAAKLPFHGFLSYAIALLLSVQVLVNLGVNIGLLPTKGLTLPLMSYGGSSMIVNCAMIGLLFRIQYELSLQKRT